MKDRSTGSDYTIVFDGGSRGNPGPGYGSYRLSTRDGQWEVVRLDFRRQMTNNEAEYHMLIAALEALLARIQGAGQEPGAVSVEVRGDSALVLKQVTGMWRARDRRMRLLRDRARSLLDRFRDRRVVLQPRQDTVRVLGH